MSYSIQQSNTSDIQPWGLEFLRIDQLCKVSDEMAITVRLKNKEILPTYYSTLYQLYIVLCPYMEYKFRIIFLKMIKKIENDFEEMNADEQAGIKDLPEGMIKHLTDFHKWLLIFKKIVGFSAPTTKNIRTKDKMKTALL